MSKTESETQKRVLKCAKETTSLKGVAGNFNGALLRELRATAKND